MLTEGAFEVGKDCSESGAMVKGPVVLVPTKSQAYTGNEHLHLWLLWYKEVEGECYQL